MAGIIMAALVVMWAIGFTRENSSNAIHLLLVAAAVLMVVKHFNGRNRMT